MTLPPVGRFSNIKPSQSRVPLAVIRKNLKLILMHKFITLLTIILLFSKAYGQTTIKGNFKSFPSTDFRIVYNQSTLNEFQGETLAKEKTNTNGEFLLHFELSSENFVLLFISNQFFRLWVKPGTVLIVDEENNSMFFRGETSKQNNFLYQSGIMIPVSVPTTIKENKFEPLKQIKYLDSVEQKRLVLFKISIDTNQVSKKFISYCTGEISYFSYLNKNQYSLQNIYGPNKIQPGDIPLDYYGFWQQFQLLDDSCISVSYQSALRDYIEYLTSKQLNIFNEIPDKEKYYQMEFRILDSILAAHPHTREKMKAERILFLIKYFDLPQLVQSQIVTYGNEFPGSDYTTLIQKKWSQKNGNAFTKPIISLKDTSGKLFNTNSLRGKVIYIDFWGSWCKPCLEQLPNSEKLQEKFKQQDVAFIFIDFYDTKEKWLKTIQNKKLKGIHLKSEKEDIPFFDKIFGVRQGFPRYALLDKNGLLITTSAPFPSDEDAVTLINKYLK